MNDYIWRDSKQEGDLNWMRELVLKNSSAKLVWDFEFNLPKTTTSRRPDLILVDKERNKIWVCNMVCPQQANIAAKTKKTRERESDKVSTTCIWIKS